MDSVMQYAVLLLSLVVSGWVSLRALRILGDANTKTTAALISLTEKPSATHIATQLTPTNGTVQEMVPFRRDRRPPVGSA